MIATLVDLLPVFVHVISKLQPVQSKQVQSKIPININNKNKMPLNIIHLNYATPNYAQYKSKRIPRY